MTALFKDMSYNHEKSMEIAICKSLPYEWGSKIVPCINRPVGTKFHLIRPLRRSHAKACSPGKF